MMGQELLLEGVEVLGAVVSFGLLRELTQQHLVIVDHCLVNFVTRLAGLNERNTVPFRIDFFPCLYSN